MLKTFKIVANVTCSQSLQLSQSEVTQKQAVEANNMIKQQQAVKKPSFEAEKDQAKAAFVPDQVHAPQALMPSPLLTSHPLQHVWSLYYCKHDKDKRWEDCMKHATKFSTIEQFWSVYNHIRTPYMLSVKFDFYLFKEDIQPMWEDPQNIGGGRWLISIDKDSRAAYLDHLWLELELAVIGEQFEDFGHLICGAVVNMRQKGDKISLWIRSNASDDQILAIGNTLRCKLNMKPSWKIRFEMHQDLAQKTCSYTNAKFTL